MKHLLFVFFAFLSLSTLKASNNYHVSFSVVRNVQNDDKEKMTEKHKQPARILVSAYVENDKLFIQNYPTESKMTFKDQFGESIMEGVYDASELILVIPEGAEEFDIYTANYVYHGILR